MSLLTSTNTPSVAGEYYIPITGAVNPFPIPGPAGPQGAVGPQGAQGLQGVNAYGSWYYSVGLLPPAPQTMSWTGTDIYFSLVSIPPGTDTYLRALQTQFLSTGAMTLYISTVNGGGAAVGFTAAVTAINFFDGLGYAQFTYTLVGPIPVGILPGAVVNVFDGGGTVGPAGPPGPAGAAGAAATIVVGATNTLPPGSLATVVNSGTPNAAILDFGIPEGAQGPPGPAGPPDWSNYPAVSNVDTGGFNITNVNTVNAGTLGSTNIDCYQSTVTGFGTLQVGSPVLLAPNPGTLNVNGTATIQRGTSNTYINAGGIVYQGDSVIPGANGVRFGTIPVSGINTCRMELNTVTAPAAIQLVAPSFVTIDTAGAANITAAGAALVQAGNTVTIESAAKDIRLQGTAGTFSDVTMFGGTLGGMGNLTGQAVTGVAIGNVNAIGGVGPFITVSTDLSGGAGVDYLTQGDVISNTVGSTPNSLNAIGTRVRFRDTTEFFVSNNGNDITGDGSILNPYATIQKAITQAELISSAALLGVINVASGHYTENLTFNKGYVMLNGVLSTQTANEVTEINGSITISCAGAADLFNRQVIIQGFNITCIGAQTITDNSTTSHAVTFQDCKIATVERAFNGISTGADARTYFSNCEILQTSAAITDSTIFINRGAVEIERLDVTTDGNAPCLELAGNAVLFRCSLTTFENTNASATVAPICLITTSSTAVQPFGNTTFAYTSAVSKAASPNSSAIRIASGVGTTLALLNCYFTMTGLIGSGNNVITYNGVGTPTLLMNECRSLYIPVVAPFTTTIAAGITKVNYTNINGPAAGSYSSSAIQPAAAAGAATTLTFNTTEKQFNTSLVASSRIYTAATGAFRFDYSIQMDNNSGGSQNANIWIAKNGTAVPRSASTITLASNAKQLPFVSYTLDLNAGDYLEVIFNATDPNVRALAAAAAAPVPAIPSIIVNLTQIGS
jgi:hypothetical protein